MFACDTAARIASVCAFVTVPVFTRRLSASFTNGGTSLMSSTIADDPPSASSAFAEKYAATCPLRQWTSGRFARSAASASAAVFRTDAGVTPVFFSGAFFLRTIISSLEMSSMSCNGSLSSSLAIFLAPHLRHA